VTRRLSPAWDALLLVALASPAWCAGPPWGGPGSARKPHPAIVALRGCTATLRTNLGDVELRLEPDAAPNTARAFVKMALRGAFDGASFATVFKGRMVVLQARANAGAAQPLDYEKTPLPATAGAVLMDRLPDGRNCPTRLLIMTTDQTHLDGDYTVFARVTKGLDVLRQIAAAPARPNDGSPAPLEDLVVEQAVIAKKAPGDKNEEKTEN